MKPVTISSRYAALSHLIGAIQATAHAAAFEIDQTIDIPIGDIAAKCKAQLKPGADLARTISSAAEKTGRPGFQGIEEGMAKMLYLSEREIESLARWFCREDTQ